MIRGLVAALAAWYAVMFVLAFADDDVFEYESRINEILALEHRDDKNKSRDPYRNPAKTLGFFEVEPNHAVLEVWPGSGWYTEVLAPFIRNAGILYAGHFPKDSGVPFYDRSRQAFKQKLKKTPKVYDQVSLISLHPVKVDGFALPKNTLDRILTFRNVHNWTKAGFDQEMFDHFFQMLKPGGVLGVVEHRAKSGTSLEQMIASGYMTEDYVIKLAKQSGFVLEASSQINANPKDTADHPKGVWTLPPSLRLGAEEKYLNIGESDRMTLKFRKPALQ